MQPCFAPWSGLFNLMGQVDVFIFLDDAQFERGGWDNRNRVLVDGKAHWLTVPVRRQHLEQRLNEIETDDQLPWRRKHMALLQQVYGKHPYARDMFELAELVQDPGLKLLADLNIALIERAAERLNLRPIIHRASALNVTGRRTQRLIDICQRLGCTEYLSPRGASEYLEEDRFVDLTETTLLFQCYRPSPYPQRKVSGFVSHLSILDVIANLGWRQSAAYVQGVLP